jgi:hypothetical protein
VRGPLLPASAPLVERLAALCDRSFVEAGA